MSEKCYLKRILLYRDIYLNIEKTSIDEVGWPAYLAPQYSLLVPKEIAVRFWGHVAQLVEQSPFKGSVTGSNPVVPTIFTQAPAFFG